MTIQRRMSAKDKEEFLDAIEDVLEELDLAHSELGVRCYGRAVFPGTTIANRSGEMTNTQYLQIVCPHCSVAGSVRSKRVKVKRGVSGGKLTFAIFTAGLSLFFIGLSRKQEVTRNTCGNCGQIWHVE